MTLNTLDTQNASTQHIDVARKNVLSHCTSWWYIMTFSEYNDNGKMSMIEKTDIVKLDGQICENYDP